MPLAARWKVISGGNANNEGIMLENTCDSSRDERTCSEGCDSDRTERTERFMVHISKSRNQLIEAPKMRTDQLCFSLVRIRSKVAKSRSIYSRRNIFMGID
jgi:hypothetical protein